MRSSGSVLITALTTSAVAAPTLSEVEGRQVLATWPATNFRLSFCHGAACIVNFDISAPANYVDGAPAFNAQCSPINTGVASTRSKCTPENVEALWKWQDDDIHHVEVFHTFTSGGSTKVSSGSADFEANINQPTSFAVAVKSVG